MERNKSIEEQHSVKLSCNAKGQFAGEVKCYGNTPEEALERTTKIIKLVEAVIKEKNGV